MHYEELTYHFVSEPTRSRFEEDPELGGLRPAWLWHRLRSLGTIHG
jgi:hypothetical protein